MTCSIWCTVFFLTNHLRLVFSLFRSVHVTLRTHGLTTNRSSLMLDSHWRFNSSDATSLFFQKICQIFLLRLLGSDVLIIFISSSMWTWIVLHILVFIVSGGSYVSWVVLLQAVLTPLSTLRCLSMCHLRSDWLTYSSSGWVWAHALIKIL